jgi:hypothetical protein
MIILRQKEFRKSSQDLNFTTTKGSGIVNKIAKRDSELQRGGGDVHLGRFRNNLELFDLSSEKSASEYNNSIDYEKNKKLKSVHKETPGYMRGAHRNYNTKPSIFTKIPFIGEKIKAKEDAKAREKLNKIITYRGGGPVIGHRRGIGIVAGKIKNLAHR